MALEIRVQQRWDRWSTEIWVFERLEGTRTAILNVESIDKGVAQIKRTIVEGGAISLAEFSPFLVIGGDFAKEFLPALAKALEDAKIERPSESFIAGKLEAVQKHLDDMRNLVMDSAYMRVPTKFYGGDNHGSRHEGPVSETGTASKE